MLGRRHDGPRSVTSSGQSQPTCKCGAANSFSLRSPNSRRFASYRLRASGTTRRASEVFCDQLSQRGVVRHLRGEKLLQFLVLSLQRLQPLGVRRFHPDLVHLLIVEGRPAHPVPATQIRDQRPRLVLLQYRDDLLVAVQALARDVCLCDWVGLYITARAFRGQGQFYQRTSGSIPRNSI